ncbi:MAG: hypothetical protein A3I66_18120 [Burkholderiales bacterium RIFCSPLOWO2_02_FULL_57_36]|nr:MAG: hypothetical protein A3I66_18120 [Burkholderiales bacterium RIFCSPLOWO2_02_FULL_57_36]
MKPTPALALALMAIGMAYILYPAGKDEESPTSPATVRSAAAAAQFGPGTLPAASHGSPLQPGGVPIFAIGPNGELIINSSVMVGLDVLLAQLPEHPSRNDLARLEERCKEGLPDHAARDAHRFLHAYIAYRKAESEIEAQPHNADTTTAEARLNLTIALRRAHFGAQVADALFAAGEAQSRFGIQATRIQADPNLSKFEKSTRLEALRKTISEEGALEKDESAQAQQLMERQVALLRGRGAPESEVQQLRQQSLGAQEAQIISDMETQQAEWERRYQAFLQQKNAILSTGMSEQNRQENVDALLRRHYKAEEMQNARAYDLEYGPK